MGRILETLKQTGPRGVTTESPAVPQLAETDAEAQPNEIPFIEVGGRGTAVEGSANVLAAAPSPRKATAWPAPILNEPLTVAYQPVPAPAFLEPSPRRLAPALIAYHQPDHAVSAQYRSLLAGLTAHGPGRDARVLLLAAPTAGTGTTTVLLNLAITRARQSGQPVVVVDANLRRPALADLLGLTPEPGLRDVAARVVPLARALRETGQAGLMALTAGTVTPFAGAWPPGDALRAVIQQLRSHFDWVLVDAPSWDGGPEMIALSSACDAVYLVVRPGEAEGPVVRELGRLLPHVGSRLGGYVVTQR